MPNIYLVVKQDNPLLNPIVEESLPGDAVAKMKLLQRAILIWMNEYKKLGETQFNMYLQTLLKSQYPTDNKRILDALVAYWTTRDPYGNQQDIILDTFMEILGKIKYHQRASPYYAFIEYFKGWSGRADELSDTNGYNITAGAEINVSRYVGYGNPALLRGCCGMLERLSSSKAAHGWIVSCIENVHPDIAVWYVGWLVEQCNRIKPQTSPYGRLMEWVLGSARMADLAMDVVPVILKTIIDERWPWFLQQSKCSKVVIKYFQGYPQLSTQLLITYLLATRSKHFIDNLLRKLQKVMPSTELNSTDSRAWFANHFMGPVVTMVSESKDNSVALQLFHRMLSDADSYEFFLGTSLNGSDIIPPSAFDILHVTTQHNVFSVQHLGMVSLLHEMVQLRDKVKTQRLVTEWERRWLKDNGTLFSVSKKWVFQLIGLYDKAPAQIKQMIEQFINIGIQHDQQTSTNQHEFSKKIMELMMIGDVPEIETLFDLFSRSHEQHSKLDDDRDDEIVFIMISILLSIGEELQFAHSHPDYYPKTTTTTTTVLEQESDSGNEQKLGNKKRKVTTTRKQQASKWQSKMKGRKQQQQQQQQQQRQQQTQYSARHLLTLLSQRAISFLETVMEDEPGESPLKEIWRTKLTTEPLFYESLRSLSQAVESEGDLRGDLQALIDRCLGRLSEAKVNQARAILDFNS